MEWKCGRCGADVPEELTMCWQCCALQDGTMPEIIEEEPEESLIITDETQNKITLCCKCSSNKVVRLDADKLSYWWSDKDWSDDLTLILSDGILPRYIHFELYICTDCGYTEKYMKDTIDRQWLWQKVNKNNNNDINA